MPKHRQVLNNPLAQLSPSLMENFSRGSGGLQNTSTAQAASQTSAGCTWGTEGCRVDGKMGGQVDGCIGRWVVGECKGGGASLKPVL